MFLVLYMGGGYRLLVLAMGLSLDIGQCLIIDITSHYVPHTRV
nr:hypothetical protein Q903MT_gene3544 [Picea sitchensis]